MKREKIWVLSLLMLLNNFGTSYNFFVKKKSIDGNTGP